jgi:hypothetical protein
MEGYARCATLASTRAQLDPSTVIAARRTGARLRRVRLWPTASVRWAGRGLME